ncbi:MAG: DUF4402 domain-containing protein [Acidobacteriota bacterium]
MKTIRYPAALLLAVAGLFSAAPVAKGATASAVVSATVLGPAGEETASGAVTLSRIAGRTSDIELPSAGGHTSPVLARFRVGGGSNATFAVSLPETVVLRGRGSELDGRNLEISGFRAAGAGRLDSAGKTTISIGADVRVPAGLVRGDYAGSFPVTIAYD